MHSGLDSVKHHGAITARFGFGAHEEDLDLFSHIVRYNMMSIIYALHHVSPGNRSVSSVVFERDPVLI